jgi:OOP family OmpA-OmpF porin
MKLPKLVPLALLGLVGTASAGDLYLLGAVTHSKTSLDRSTFDTDLKNAGAAGLSSGDRGNGNQWRLQLGYDFSPNFALEAGYIDFGKARYSASYGGGTANGTLKAGGLDIAALGILPLTDSISLFGKAGLVAAKVKSSLSSSLVSSSDSSNEVRPLLGIGAGFKLSESLQLRTEYEHVSGLGKSGTTGKMNDNLVSLGLAYRF